MEICNTLEQYQDNNDWVKVSDKLLHATSLSILMQLCNENFKPSDESSWNKYSELSSDNSNESTSSHSSSDVHPHEHLLQIVAAGILSHDLSCHQENGVHVKMLSFCNCPPDPQIPKHLHYTHMK